MAISYLNGKFVPKIEATISIEDRGFNFSDGVYEVIGFKNSNLLNYNQHIRRLKESLRSIEINEIFKNFDSLKFIILNLIKINTIKSGFLYLQITRGTAARNHIFFKGIRPNILINIYPEKKSIQLDKGVKVKTSKDLRWGRCDIKSISLLPNVLGKQEAFNSGFFELWQTSEFEEITEGTTSNAFIVNEDNVIQTHPKNNLILGGVTRDNIISLAKKEGINVVENAFNMKQLYSCNEAFLTSTTLGIIPVVQVNDNVISEGKIGRITNRLKNFYKEHIDNQLTKNNE